MMTQPSEEEIIIFEKLKKETDPEIIEKLMDEAAKAHIKEMKKYDGLRLVNQSDSK